MLGAHWIGDLLDCGRACGLLVVVRCWRFRLITTWCLFVIVSDGQWCFGVGDWYRCCWRLILSAVVVSLLWSIGGTGVLVSIGSVAGTQARHPLVGVACGRQPLLPLVSPLLERVGGLL